MGRREFLATVAVLALPRAVRAQKAPTVGLLWTDSVRPSPYVATLLQALNERGYAVGRNLRIEDRVALEGYGPMAESAVALARAKVDLIVTYGVTATTAAARATRDIPIVMVMGANPVSRGVAASFARPGGNVTGVYTRSEEVTRKRIELLKELKPGLSSIGFLSDPGNAGVDVTIPSVRAAAQVLKLEVHVADVVASADIDDAIDKLAKARVGAIATSGAISLAAHADRIVSAVARHRLPAVYAVERYADAGGLMVFAPSVRKAFVRAAGYVERVLKGARPSEMPIEQVSDVELVINLKTARALGIAIPQTILQRADRAIE